MNALTAFNEISRLSFNVIRDNVELFDDLWDIYADVLDKFIFCKIRGMPLNSDERRRYEFYDCQMIDAVKSQILTHANKLPWRFMQRVIDILNRASVITLDSTDVMGKLFVNFIFHNCFGIIFLTTGLNWCWE